MANVSPEGPPAHPETSPRQIGLLLAGIVIGLLIIALAAAIWWSSIAGIVVGSFAIIIFVSNPEVWAAILRARERRPLHRQDASDSS